MYLQPTGFLADNGLKLLIFLLPPPKCCDYKFYAVLGTTLVMVLERNSTVGVSSDLASYSRVLGLLELQLWMVVRHFVGAGI